jgi:hypothetical protein
VTNTETDGNRLAMRRSVFLSCSLARRAADRGFLPVLLASALSLGCAAERSAGGAGGSAATTAASIGADATTFAALQRACFDCHSTEKSAAWNAKMAFSYWVPSHDLDAVNFSRWRGYDAKRRTSTLAAIAQVVREGDMPPVDYRVLHPSAKLTEEEKAAIVEWATAKS